MPSNASPEIYPDNTLTHYRLKLPQPISLEGQWEVGLTEILYPHQWYNIDEDCKYTYTVNGHQWWTKPLTPGFYRDPSTLLELLETNYVEEIRYRLDRQNGLISIQLAEGAQVKFEGRLAEILGFPSTSTVTSSSTINHPFDLKHIHHMFVYSDIIEPHAVGHTKVPLIRVVTVKGKYGEDISSVYDNVYYHPVKQKYFDTIEIDIRDNTGRKIPFLRGTVIATLHFRLRKAPQFI